MAETKTASGRLVSRTVRVDRFTLSQQNALWELYNSYYESVTAQAFALDLSRKQKVILLSDSGDGSLQGFSTIEEATCTVGGRSCVVVFSGDTVITKPYWGQNVLPRAFGRNIMALKLRHPFKPVIWYLLSKGYKTYLLLCRNFPNHWPRHDAPTPRWEVEIIETFARERFGEAWRPDTGVVKFTQCPGRLRANVAPLHETLLQDPEIAFFAERNPGHISGDELCCVAHVDLAYARHFLRKHVGRKLSALRQAGRLARRPEAS